MTERNERDSLPVVAWRHSITYETGAEAFAVTSSEDDPWVDIEIGHAVISYPLVRLSDARAIIDRLTAERDCARAAALEEAAKLCEGNAQIISGSPGPLFTMGWGSAAENCAAVVRAAAAMAKKD